MKKALEVNFTSSLTLFEKKQGSPLHCASTPTKGNPSYKLGKTKISKALYNSAVFSETP